MNSLFSFLALIDSPPAESVAGGGGDGLSTGSVVLGFAVVALMFVARSLVNLRAEVEELKAAMLARSPAVAASPAAVEAPTPEELVAIAAAVALVLGPNARLVSVGSAASSALQIGTPELQIWSHEGRRQVFQSHQVR